MFNKNLIVIDLEASGSSFDYDIIQWGAVKLDKEFNIIDKFDTLVIPLTTKWDLNAARVHKLDYDYVCKNGIELYDCLNRFEIFVGDKHMHSLSSWGNWDINFIVASYGKLLKDYPFSKRTYDIASIVRFACMAMGCKSSMKIGEMSCAKFLGIKVDNTKYHNALYDAEIGSKNLQEVYKRIKNKFVIKEIINV